LYRCTAVPLYHYAFAKASIYAVCHLAETIIV
jgi:hypothetical protein